MYRMTFILVMLVAVTAVAQEVPDVAETEAAQSRQKTDEQQAEREAADVSPELFDPTEETPEDIPVEFPVDI